MAKKKIEKVQPDSVETIDQRIKITKKEIELYKLLNELAQLKRDLEKKETKYPDPIIIPVRDNSPTTPQPQSPWYHDDKDWWRKGPTLTSVELRSFKINDDYFKGKK